MHTTRQREGERERGMNKDTLHAYFKPERERERGREGERERESVSESDDYEKLGHREYECR